MATTTPHRPSALMMTLGALCDPGTVRVCSECMAPVAWGCITCGAPACIASLAKFLYGTDDAKKEGR